MEQTGVKAFLKRKNVNITVKTYLIDALGAMAFGLFASLLIGTIFGTLGDKTHITLFNTIAEYCKTATGAALGVSIAHALQAPQLVLFFSSHCRNCRQCSGRTGWCTGCHHRGC